MSFRAFTTLLSAAVLLLLLGCAGGPVAGIPTAPDEIASPDAPMAQTALSEPVQPGHNLFGYWNISVDSDAGTIEAVPARATEIHLNVLSWLEFGPCFDCLKIENFVKEPNKDLTFDIRLTHPFPDPKLSGFDVRGIAMLGGSEDFPELGIITASTIESNPVLLNPDGHTTLYNPTTVGNGFLGYVKGKLAPGFATPNATLNGYKSYGTANERHHFLAGSNEAVEFRIRPVTAVWTFGYAVDASWAKPTEPVTVPGSFPITANSAEAYQIDAQLSNPIAITAGSKTTITIDVYDWQGADTIGAVQIEAPYFFSGLVDGFFSPGGPATKRFTAELTNDYGFVGQGEYPILIRVLDTSSVPGALIDNVGWKLVLVPVIINHAPTCLVQVSNLEPNPGELVTFTDISTDPEGPSDIVTSNWSWDGTENWTEQGFEVTHTFNDPGIYFVNHQVIDSQGASDTLDDPVQLDVGLFITLAEDLANKTPGTNYHYSSKDASYDSGAVIDVEDVDGPWDFTTVGLTLGSNWMRVIDDSDTEVGAFVDDFNGATTHFIKYENMFDPFFPTLYQAEYHYFLTNQLYIYGFHDPYVIGSSPFGPPDTVDSLAIPYPLSSALDYQFMIDEPGFILIYSMKAVGEGDVTVPYDGGTVFHCLVVRWRFSLSAAEPLNGGTLNYMFIADNGLVVANVIAVNDPPVYNWNTSTNKINPTGQALFQALYEITTD